MTTPLVSVIIPIYNAEKYLDDALLSLSIQTYRPLEIVFLDDASMDSSLQMVTEWASNQKSEGISIIIKRNDSNKGPGFARNEAVGLSNGALICHFDADDIMHPDRIADQVIQYSTLGDDRDTYLIGTGFDRHPIDSTPYYTHWLNNLSNDDLCTQQYRECTIICPTWIYSRCVFDKIALHRQSSNAIPNRAFVESSPEFLQQSGLSRVPEDLYFFLDHVLLGGRLIKVPRSLLTYRYTLGGWSLGSKKQDLQRVRASYIDRLVLSLWPRFQIWGYGKDGRKFLKLISPASARKVTNFLDVDDAKLGKSYYCRESGHRIPVVHFSRLARDPIIVCVASKRTLGALEANIATLNLVEGKDYYHFS